MRLTRLLLALLLPVCSKAQSSFATDRPAVTVEKSAASSRSTAPSLAAPARRAEAVRAVVAAAPASAIGLESGASFRSGDTFELRLTGMPAEDAAQYALQFTVGYDGYVNIPLAGQVRAAGLTQSQLEKAIEQKLIEEKIFRFPTATINVPPQARFVTVGGNVRAPQRIAWASDLSILAAITAAGGPGDFGGDRLELIRGGKMSVYSIKRLKKDPTQDPRLMPGDQLELR
jgi:polysaccharide export outer membrane protein